MTHTAKYIPSIPSSLGKTKSKKGNMKFILGGVVMLALVVVLIVYSTASTGAYYLTVAETLERAPTLAGQRVRVNGAVVDGSEDWRPQEMTLRFAVADESSKQQLPIVFHGPRPDNFQRAASAIIEGELMPDGTFQADTLLLKCPSRYEEEPQQVVAKSIQ